MLLRHTSLLPRSRKSRAADACKILFSLSRLLLWSKLGVTPPYPRSPPTGTAWPCSLLVPCWAQKCLIRERKGGTVARELHGATQTLHFTSSGCPLAAVAVTDSPRAPSSSTTHTLALVPTELRAEEHTGAILPPLPAMSPARTEAEPRRPAPRPGLALRHRTRRQLCEAMSLPEPQITPNCPDFTAAQPRGHTPRPHGRRGSS